MLKKLFSKKIETRAVEIYSPLDGEAIPLEEVPDPVFAQKMMGDGLAIIPKNGKVVSPINGKVVQIFPTKHAVGLVSEEGLEILIHIGLETVELNGEGFEVEVNAGETVKVGDPLINVDLDYLEQKHKEIVTPIIITNMLDKVGDLEYVKKNNIVTRGDIIMKCRVKAI
ncbi:PTS sugar transporter subunit IIA [Parageobacillus thermoglucosidasius]|uniref:PTS glucose transporter subunit IIA n=1 Tax=Parageobacillus thermoglucosidasius TaxID=1426 RepID=A0AAN0YRF7_PARTM|nr:PTS glucose transporter subunit IIA [Parageobacillus thermoglucosidasius]ALF09470.1 PTS glucose transporter subunit IIA [Parageobacillus thermoglucosidasius]ANZ29553.1 PTS glucose transporter subunit IIA [Parageobacillus thermoglucosidasius]APM80291.1 PTS glucose transporter subunit IIA [Parageobacillus thermoglucosidasius]KJX70168.1 PTS glucose transporter subunit IIA [Parageobacillus thermoglucosidasius]MBY6268346.1 PTS glucose transporter subunit IIA [Parageobacillus thermoglucosidasius]